MNRELKINVVSKDVTYKELDEQLTNPTYKTAKNYENWCYECVKSVTGDDLTGKSESELREYFCNIKPNILTTDWVDVLALVYRGHIFLKRRSELEVYDTEGDKK